MTPEPIKIKVLGPKWGFDKRLGYTKHTLEKFRLLSTKKFYYKKSVCV